MSNNKSLDFYVERNNIRLHIAHESIVQGLRDRWGREFIERGGSIAHIKGTMFYVTNGIDAYSMMEFVLGPNVVFDPAVPEAEYDRMRSDGESLDGWVTKYERCDGALGTLYNLREEFRRAVIAELKKYLGSSTYNICDREHATRYAATTGFVITRLAYQAIPVTGFVKDELYFGDVRCDLRASNNKPYDMSRPDAYGYTTFEIRVNGGDWVFVGEITNALSHVNALMCAEIRARCYAQEAQDAEAARMAVNP